MADLLLLNGPNLNLLGSREPDVYGTESLDDIQNRLITLASELEVSLQCFQSNAEHELVERIQTAQGQVKMLLFNPGAFTHTSIALRDALLATSLPFVEIHLSNPMARETFRHTSYFSDIAVGVIMGFGSLGYEAALKLAARKIRQLS